MSGPRLWYTKSGDVERGPFDAPTVRRSLESGRVKRTILVRAEDESEWRPVSTVLDITRAGAPPAREASSRGAAPRGGLDEDGKLVVFGALACSLTYLGLFFGIAGVVLARKKLRSAPTKSARMGYVLSVVGIGIQSALVAAVVAYFALAKR